MEREVSGPDPVDGSGVPGNSAEAAVAGFEQGPMLAFVVEGEDLRVAAYSATAEALMGPRLHGVPLHEAMPELVGQQFDHLYLACLQTGEVQTVRGWRTVLRPPGRDPVELYLDFAMSPWRAADDSVRGVVAAGYDSTEEVHRRQRAEVQRDEATRQLADARQLVQTMQGALLPAALPVLPRVDVDACYLLAEADMASGGDWFDAVVRPDGRLAVVVGDVVGHGTAASATMGQLRAVVRERLLSPNALADVLADVDRYAAATPEARSATLCVVELDRDTGELGYCTAGHPPPLVVADGAVRPLAASGGPPVGAGASYAVCRDLLLPGAMMLLYTDGLVERPQRSVQQSTAELQQVVRDVVLGLGLARGARGRLVERVTRLTLELMTRATGYDDDITVLALQRRDPPADLQLRLVADDDAAARTQTAVGGWCRALDLRAADRIALEHAVTELVSNSVRHAYRGAAPGPVSLRLSLTRESRVVVEVDDEGRWSVHAPDTGGDGHGLAMARGLLDHVEITPGDDDAAAGGTRVVGRREVSRRARVLSALPSATPRATHEDTAFGLTVAGRRVALAGPVLAEGADLLRRRLHALTAEATTAPVVVDLTRVTHLGSVGVRALAEEQERSRVPRLPGLVLVAPEGSVAQHVLDVVHLPYQRRAPAD